MIYYIESRQTDPYHNLALEQFVFDELPKENSYIMLWQNHNSIIIGKHQNTLEEINAAFVKEHNITVARRLSGGGAVYHDMGNLNFTFIFKAENSGHIDFSLFCEPISAALRSFGVPVEITGRNDMCVEGRKFSGNAQYIKQGRVMHHGTILYDSDLRILSQALNPGDDKIESRGIKSVQNRVTNIRPHMKSDMPMDEFWEGLKEHLGHSFDMQDLSLGPEDHRAVDELRDRVYAQWSWNYGRSPPHTLLKVRRIEGCGKVEILMDIGREGIIKNMAFYGDFFGRRDPAELGEMLRGLHFLEEELRQPLSEVEIQQYFQGLENEDFLSLLFS